jgi:hypothetical protein
MASDRPLECTLNVLDLICRDTSSASSDSVMSLVHDLLDRSFESGDLDVSFAAFRFLVSTARSCMILSLLFCWDRLLSLFDSCISDWRLLQQLTSLFNEMVESHPQLIDCDSLMAKCLGYISMDGVDMHCLVLIFAVIDSLCEQFVSVITARCLVDRVLRIAFKLLELTFDPTDLNPCQFFESRSTL